MSNRFFTIMIVPEKTSHVRKIIVPAWILKGSAIGLSLLALFGLIMFLDYWYVMNQIDENKSLKIENRRLRLQVQVFKNKITSVESTLERIKTFATRLKVITNIEERASSPQAMSGSLPDASINTNNTTGTLTTTTASTATNTVAGGPTEAQILPVTDTEDPQMNTIFHELEDGITAVNTDSLQVEEMLQDLYELLADQKAFLSALPTRKPAVGYFTSGFGIRRSPYGGRVKMHEGLDIANKPGTTIKATADGIVNIAESKPGYGQTVILEHGYGVETWYAHARKLLVTKGQKVQRGDSIALLGSSGRATGPHLHYEVRVNGTPVDPLSYILEN
ncbi:MAG: M23 family metallopeptidase [Bdellovibrionota bacterium]